MDGVAVRSVRDLVWVVVGLILTRWKKTGDYLLTGIKDQGQSVFTGMCSLSTQ